LTTYPLSTLAAQITSAGISAPSYSDIYQSLQASFQSIYGSDSYLDPDSQDGQMLAIFAQAISDCNNTAIATYNSFSPATAQGAGLSSNVKINGLRRLVPTNSTVNLLIGGTAGTIISSGIAADGNGNQWLLPSTVTIGSTGSVLVTATAANPGAISASPNTVTSIFTAVLGWQTVTNPSAAVPGALVETDAALRVRQSASTSLPAQSILAAIYGALANITGVEQLQVYQNDLNTVNSLGMPPHSIAAVVQGGDATAIAQTINEKKNPGTTTFGTTSVLVQDSVGIPNKINFFVPTPVEIAVNITLKALSGYTSTIGSQILNNVLDYINSLGIYANDGLLSLSSLYEPIYATTAPKTYNVTGLQIAIKPNSPLAQDLAIAFNQLPFISAADINLTVT